MIASLQPQPLIVFTCLALAVCTSWSAQKEFTEQPLVTTDPIPRASSIPSTKPTGTNQGTRFVLDPVSTENVAAAPRIDSAKTNQPKLAKPASLPSSQLQADSVARSAFDVNDVLLQAIKKMPDSGSYSVSAKASANLRKSISLTDTGAIDIRPQLAKPSFCSGATYLIFLQALKDLESSGALRLEKEANAAFLHKSQPDGVGFWGRWNANGPGVARLFYELSAGENFTDIAKAKPGDFLKIWWTEEIGSKEKGHLVLYLGRRKNEEGEELLRFWSSNMPDGYGSKEVPISKAKFMLFSRLTRPQALKDAARLPQKDEFLASMLTKSVTMEEVLDMTGAK